MTNNSTPHITKEEILKEFEQKFMDDLGDIIVYTTDVWKVTNFLSHSLDQYAEAKVAEFAGKVMKKLKPSVHKDNPTHNKDEIYCCIECHDDASINAERQRVRDIIQSMLNHK